VNGLCPSGKRREKPWEKPASILRQQGTLHSDGKSEPPKRSRKSQTVECPVESKRKARKFVGREGRQKKQQGSKRTQSELARVRKRTAQKTKAPRVPPFRSSEKRNSGHQNPTGLPLGETGGGKKPHHRGGEKEMGLARLWNRGVSEVSRAQDWNDQGESSRGHLFGGGGIVKTKFYWGRKEGCSSTESLGKEKTKGCGSWL